MTILGGGFEMTHGENLHIHPDGTGVLLYWGWGEEGKSGQLAFHWRSVAPLRVHMWFDASNGWSQADREFEYDFFIDRDAYGTRLVLIYERKPINDGSPEFWDGRQFWVANYALVHGECVGVVAQEKGTF